MNEVFPFTACNTLLRAKKEASGLSRYNLPWGAHPTTARERAKEANQEQIIKFGNKERERCSRTGEVCEGSMTTRCTTGQHCPVLFLCLFYSVLLQCTCALTMTMTPSLYLLEHVVQLDWKDDLFSAAILIMVLFLLCCSSTRCRGIGWHRRREPMCVYRYLFVFSVVFVGADHNNWIQCSFVAVNEIELLLHAVALLID